MNYVRKGGGAHLNFVKKTTSLEYRERYQNLKKQVKKVVKKIKEAYLEKKISKLEKYFQKRNSRTRPVTELERRPRNP